MRVYACGFLFSEDRSQVLLIRKLRPAWQAGKLNGVGGKLEPGETPLEAQRREFREEAGADIANWREILTLSGPGWIGHFFRAFGDLGTCCAITDEPLQICDVGTLPSDVIPNLHWLIPLLLDDDVSRGTYRITHVVPLAPDAPTL